MKLALSAFRQLRTMPKPCYPLWCQCNDNGHMFGPMRSESYRPCFRLPQITKKAPQLFSCMEELNGDRLRQDDSPHNSQYRHDRYIWRQHSSEWSSNINVYTAVRKSQYGSIRSRLCLFEGEITLRNRVMLDRRDRTLLSRILRTRLLRCQRSLHAYDRRMTGRQTAETVGSRHLPATPLQH
jgi:hypothetical protein